ncbi:protein FAR1-RELATED SEQUENCE 5-like [Prunus avium]|uniref:Protein FAR1-RELATED SEQUENCE 5-like n=1 Tax=Prunus avium TaxID=42229 RepID=A0A6P5SND1_PRUAV|nr:protein FAR1-RELATED SEQUENCE 5-like [Prunus avium]
MSDSVATICEDNLDYKPICDMEFLSEQAAYEFYNEYGRRAGFNIRRDSQNKNKNTGQIISRVFVCCKEGFRPKDKQDYLTKSSRAETRTCCNAKMSIKLNKSNGKYWVSHFMEYHNHPLVRQECTHMLPSHRRISASQATEVYLTEESGIPLRQAYELMGRQVGGRESLGYIKQDQKNYLQTKRQRKLAYGEVGSLLKYFQNEALENPSFFYAMQLDCDEQITNIFWADAKMIVDYGQFGDCVCFDTTYKTNEANRPFGVFVGFNHHREIAIFGVALLYNETANSFIRLFETFSEAMSKKAPKTLFTDQDAAMAKACAHVMSDTYHRLCTWHIMQNAMKHVNSLFRCTCGVRSVLTQFMDYYEEEDEFLVAWDSMLDEYNVRGHLWLEIIFDLRKKWAMAYCKWSWSAGVKTTQISESFNATLKDYLNVDHDVVQFFMHFERVLNDKRYKELEAEYALCQKLPKVTILVSMVVKAGNIYTNI